MNQKITLIRVIFTNRLNHAKTACILCLLCWTFQRLSCLIPTYVQVTLSVITYIHGIIWNKFNHSATTPNWWVRFWWWWWWWNLTMALCLRTFKSSKLWCAIFTPQNDNVREITWTVQFEAPAYLLFVLTCAVNKQY